METFSDVINRWPTVVAFADDTGAEIAAAYKWRERGNIPSSSWLSVIDAAQRRGFADITSDRLTQIASASPDSISTMNSGS